MNKLWSIFFILVSVQSHGQSSKISADFFSHLESDALILSEKGMIRGEGAISSFVSTFIEAQGNVKSYQRNFGIEVHKALDFEVGEIATSGQKFSVMFLKKTDNPKGGKIEFLVIFENKQTNLKASALDDPRNLWMELCNAHKANELVEDLYTPDAYYYNRGRLLQGTGAISTEYGYMNNPNYSLKLTPEHVVFVTSDIAYEIGQCSKSYNLPYMLLWQKQADGNWKILMDSNY